MVKPLLDTCILIDYLNGVIAAERELVQYPNAAISLITWMEVLVGARTDLILATRQYLGGFDLLPIDNSIAEIAVDIRQSRKIKLPDAIILATAQKFNLLLVTRNIRDFAPNSPGIRIPY